MVADRTMPASRWSRFGREGKEIGLKLGDTITVNVLGRNVTARIANFRRSNGNDGHQLRDDLFAQHLCRRAAFLAGDADRWRTPLRPGGKNPQRVTRAFPAVTTVRVKDALDVVNRIVGQLGRRSARRRAWR